MRHLYLGIMSGTSMDGIDLALVDFNQRPVNVVAVDTVPYEPELNQDIHALCHPSANEIVAMGNADRRIAMAFAGAVNEFLQKNNIDPANVAAIGSHGQTIRHYPDGKHGFTLQIGDPNTLAVNTGIDVIADFRRKDIALGGQGAPLVPAFHQAMFSCSRADRIILNIGGISNISYLPSHPDKPVCGFDTGPGNGLMDAWCKENTGQAFDRGGAWAASGKTNEALLSQLMSHPYFQVQGPKSTGRELFNLPWLHQQLAQFGEAISPESVQATLAQFTANSIAVHIEQFEHVHEVFVCGGGVYNDFLMECLETRLHNYKVDVTDELGIAADFVEAVAFAWLAHAFDHNIAGNVPNVTGASRAAILGARFPAN